MAMGKFGGMGGAPSPGAGGGAPQDKLVRPSRVIHDANNS